MWKFMKKDSQHDDIESFSLVADALREKADLPVANCTLWN